jgi:hypothetical protein
VRSLPRERADRRQGREDVLPRVSREEVVAGSPRRTPDR